MLKNSNLLALSVCFYEICHDVYFVIHSTRSNFDQISQNASLEINITTKEGFACGCTSTFVNFICLGWSSTIPLSSSVIPAHFVPGFFLTFFVRVCRRTVTA